MDMEHPDAAPESHEHHASSAEPWPSVDEQREYKKFAGLFAAIVAVSLLLSLGHFTIEGWMQYFMGITFLVFATTKFFDLENVAYGLREYDLIARRWHWYSWLYPFIELFLGISYIFGAWPVGRNVATILFTTVGLIGVKRTLGRGARIRCACLGSLIKLPLSKLTLAENLTMGIMAAVMLVLELV